MKTIKYLIFEQVLPITLGMIYIKIMGTFGELDAYSFLTGATFVIMLFLYEALVKERLNGKM